MSIEENIGLIKKELPRHVKLVAAAKTRSIEEIKQAIEAGVDAIGENYIQEAEAKYKEFKGKIPIHCIGHLQSNKAKKAVEIFDMIETIDSLNLAKEIDKQSQKLNKIMPVLVEINSAREESKAGCMPDHAQQLVKDISLLKNIKVLGLMTMGPIKGDIAAAFRETKSLFDHIKSLSIPNTDMQILSMGMSGSYKIAVKEGANMVRIGTKIFGPR
ncbi:MAG TPA: YggS family pyridoxal phosphate-dependent enzyme [Candidatus Nanoarchaeia archaeon]|nr:YggS family pyridoxal phosphate-dependent enzyme [Candidatus Nanoarchaeia archaeon]